MLHSCTQARRPMRIKRWDFDLTQDFSEQQIKSRRGGVTVGTHKVLVHVVHAGPHVEHHVVQHAERVPHVGVLGKTQALRYTHTRHDMTRHTGHVEVQQSSSKDNGAIVTSHGHIKDTTCDRYQIV